MISRLLVSHAVAVACTAVLAAGGSAAAAPAPPLPPRCAGQLAARFTDTATDGAVHRMTIVLSTTARTACTLAGFPALLLPSAQAAPLPAGHLTLANVVVLAPGSTASFALRYVTSQAPATAPCSVSVAVNGSSAAADGTIPLAACASITRIDVTSYGFGMRGPAIPSAPQLAASAPPCNAFDLQLREVRTAPDGQPAFAAIYAVQNRGETCRIAGSTTIRVMDASGTPFALHVAPRRTTAALLTLAPAEEASFTVAYDPPFPHGCPTASYVAAYFAPDPTPVAGTATITACAGAGVRVSDLRTGLPIAPGTFGTIPSH